MPNRTPPFEMPHTLSLYFDLLRFLAATSVLTGHISSSPFTEGIEWYGLNRFGDTAVMVFFILSGYVISHVTSDREKTARTYIYARVSRLYSVGLIALALTFALDSIGMWLDPSFYAIKKILWKAPSLSGYLSSLLFINEYQIFQFNGIAPGTNGPYWSLSFEATYYMAAGFVLFSRLTTQLIIIPILLYCAGKTIAALFPIWILGFMLHRLNITIDVSRQRALLMVIISAAALIASPWIIRRMPSGNFGHFFPWGRAPFDRNLVGDYMVALIFGLHLIFARAYALNRPNIFKRDKLIRWLGSLTFPLYLLHYPLICFLSVISTWEKGSISNAAFLFVGALSTAIALAPLGEWLKIKFRRHLPPARPKNPAT
jgi:peptidoglycan/LPS O-acetylase OafA/YrhL